jgi:hypothetical protein
LRFRRPDARAGADGLFLLESASAKGNRRRARRARPQNAVATKEKPRVRGPGFEIAKINESVDQKLTRTPPVKAVLLVLADAQ